MNEPFSRPRHSWPKKFATAIRGCWLGIHGHNSFWIHIPAAVLVMAAAIYLHVSVLEMCVLVLCITMVVTAELFNSALESLARAVTQVEDPHVAQSLDIASGAVLLAAIGSVIVGLIVFVPRLMAL